MTKLRVNGKKKKKTQKKPKKNGERKSYMW